jgi:hypothetical protein
MFLSLMWHAHHVTFTPCLSCHSCDNVMWHPHHVTFRPSHSCHPRNMHAMWYSCHATLVTDLTYTLWYPCPATCISYDSFNLCDMYIIHMTNRLYDIHWFTRCDTLGIMAYDMHNMWYTCQVTRFSRMTCMSSIAHHLTCMSGVQYTYHATYTSCDMLCKWHAWQVTWTSSDTDVLTLLSLLHVTWPSDHVACPTDFQGEFRWASPSTPLFLPSGFPSFRLTTIISLLHNNSCHQPEWPKRQTTRQQRNEAVMAKWSGDGLAVESGANNLLRS